MNGGSQTSAQRVRLRLGAGAFAQVPERARVLVWVVLAASLPFLGAAWWQGAVPPGAAAAIGGVLWAVNGVFLAMLRRRRRAEVGYAAGVAALATVSAAMGVHGILAADPVSPPVVLCPLVLGAALVFPWGALVQAVGVVLAALAVFVSVTVVEGHPGGLGAAATLGVLLSLAASVVAAHAHAAFATGSAALARERGEAENRAERERWFRELLESSPDISLVVRRDGTVLYASAGVQRVLGLGPEALRGRYLEERVHAADRRLLQRLLAGEAGTAGEPVDLRVWGAGGERVWLEVLAEDRSDDPVIGGVVLRARDATRRRRTTLQREALLEIARDIAGTLDVGELLDRVQRRVVALLPCDRAAAFYRDETADAFRMVAHYGIPESLLPAARRLEFRDDLPVSRHVRAGGSVVINDPVRQEWLPPAMLAEFGIGCLLGVPLMAGDRLLGVLNLARVSRDRPFTVEEVRFCEGIARQVAVALASAEAYRRQQLAAQVSAALARVGRELIASVDTPEVLRRLCQVTAEVLNCHGSRTVLWDPEACAYRPVASWGDSAEEWESARLIRIPRDALAGLIRALEAEDVVPYLQGRDRPQGLLARLPRVNDIRSALHIALRRGEEVIGFQVAYDRGVERPFSPAQIRIARGISHFGSLALENARLVEELEAANRLKSDFVANMSHELRSPLNIILGYQSLLLEGAFGPLTPEERDTLDRIGRAARELLDLVNATLDLSRLEARQIPVEAEVVDVRELVRDLESGLVRPRADVRYRSEVAADLPVVVTDRIKLRMILKNLLENAFRFTPRGEVVLRVAPCEDAVVFAVADTGVGIAPEERERIFEPFYQVAESSQSPGGVGLGLYLVRRLAEILGGSIELESRPGHGSVFRLRLPLRRAAPARLAAC